MPFVHAKLADAHLHIQAVVVLGIDSALDQELLLHVLVNDFTVLNLGDELLSGLGIIAHEALVPRMRVLFGAFWSAASTDTDEYSDFPAWPFVYCCLVERSGRWVEGATPVVMEQGLAYPYRLEGEADGRSCASGLPDFTVVFRGGFLSRVVGAEQGGFSALGRSFVVCGDGTVTVSATKFCDSSQECVLTFLSCIHVRRRAWRWGLRNLRDTQAWPSVQWGCER